MTVPNEERLYRRIPFGHNLVVRHEGKWRASSQAFGDRYLKPSVDLASLCKTGMAWTQEVADNGVARLVTGDVRGISVVAEPEKNKKVAHTMDVIPRPIKDKEGERDNPAHAQIEPEPTWATKSAFKKLQERLALIAEVGILPRCVRAAADPDGVVEDGS